MLCLRSESSARRLWPYAPVPLPAHSSLFGFGAPGRLTNDEESSGIINITKLVAGPGDSAQYFLLDAQVHTKPSVARPDLIKGMTSEQIAAFDNLVVEGGALYLLKIDSMGAVFS